MKNGEGMKKTTKPRSNIGKDAGGGRKTRVREILEDRKVQYVKKRGKEGEEREWDKMGDMKV